MPESHLIPRYKGDFPNLKGGVRGVIPSKQSYSVKKRLEKPSTSAKNDKPSETETL